MAAESSPQPKVEMDNSDFNAMIREQLREAPPDAAPETPEADVPERDESALEAPKREKEPAVIVSEQPSGRPSPTEQSEEVTRALSTISRLEAQVRDLQTQRETLRSVAPSREPQIEFAEVIPGVQLPKDPRMWPVQLTPDLVKAAGLDPEAAPGLNVLANAFLLHINNLLTPQILGQVDATYRSRETASASVNAFFTRYPDLKDKQDLLELVEARARDADRIHERYAGSDYMDQIGMRTRARIAALRGQSIEQYNAGLATNAVAATGTASRASTTPVRRAGRAAATTPNQRELDDMLVKD
jgi:hypothetical protein